MIFIIMGIIDCFIGIFNGILFINGLKNNTHNFVLYLNFFASIICIVLGINLIIGV